MNYFQDNQLDIRKTLRKLIRGTTNYHSCSAESICETINKSKLYQLYLEKISPQNPRAIKQALVYWAISNFPELKANQQISVFWTKKTELVLWKDLSHYILTNPTSPLIEFHKDWRRLYKNICLTKNIDLKSPVEDGELTVTHEVIKNSYTNCRFSSNEDKSNVAWSCTLFMISRNFISGSELDRRKCGRTASIDHKWVSTSLDFLQNKLGYNPTDEERIVIQQLQVDSEKRYMESQNTNTNHKTRQKSRKKRKIVDNYTKYGYIYKASQEFIQNCKATTFLFVIENPKNYLHDRPFMKPLYDKVWDVSMCMFGKKYSKRSTLFNNMNLEEEGHLVCGSNNIKCSELIERNATKHQAIIGQNHALSHGQHEMMLRCEIPIGLAEVCIQKALKLRHQKAKKQLFVIDICCGWQSVKKAVDKMDDVKYIGVDIDHIKKTNETAIHTDFVVDLSEENFYDVVNSICVKYDLLLCDLLMIWASPPCTTYCHLMNVNRSKGSTSHRILTREHEHYLEPLPGSEGDIARRHDLLISNLLEFLNVSKQQISTKTLSLDNTTNPIEFLQEFNSSKDAQNGLLTLMNLYTSNGASFNINIGPVNFESYFSTGNTRAYSK